MVSATIRIARRLKRSATVPPSGPSSACGNNAMMAAMARALVDPVVCVTHQIRTNCVSELPISDNAWPVQIVQKRKRHGRLWWAPVMKTPVFRCSFLVPPVLY